MEIDFSKTRVLVVGDVMLDRYWTGATERISPEAPVPVVRVSTCEERPGGAANVAVNLASLGSDCCLIGVIGADEAGQRLAGLLAAAGVQPDLFVDPRFRTVTKLRVLSRHQQLVRLDFEEEPPRSWDAEWWPKLVSAWPTRQILVVSDYGKKTVTRVPALIDEARRSGKPVIVDPKGRDFGQYRGATLLTPNRSEFEAVVGPCPGRADLEAGGRRLRADLGLEALLITLGDEGMMLIEASGKVFGLPAEAHEVADVTGAGDTVVATVGAALAAGVGLEEAVRLANRAAGLVVAKLGAAQVTAAELEAAQDMHPGQAGVVDEETLIRLVRDFRSRGLRLVMTNGCFDLIHAGHVRYLAQARALGDALVVAVNSDASVRKLKGTGRPVIPLEQRMAVLAGLASVDWVVAFDEGTPERLICRLLPEILVKGGDWEPASIAGAACVEQAGGRVEVLPYLEGLSTSHIIDTIRASWTQEG